MVPDLKQIGKYRIERELGHGGMGVVYKAFDPVVERTVAIKTIRLDVENSGELVYRLKREARSVGQLEHSNIVTLYDAGEADGLFYLAMQLIHGETLENRIARKRWLGLKEICELFQQICAGLDYAHGRGVIHRDLKPANIMITDEGLVKLTDFGIAKLVDVSASTSGLIVGTPNYMSPEQALGKPLDRRSDIFSLGSILYELITGEKAFPGQNSATVIYRIVHEAPTPVCVLQPGLDPALEAMVMLALAKAPGDRVQTCGELANAIEAYLNKLAASIPKTAVECAPPFSSSVSTAAQPASRLVQVTPVAHQSAGAQTVFREDRLPLLWLGAGVLGTLLLVILILLVVQLRNPSTVSTPPSATASSNLAPPPPSGYSATATQSKAAHSAANTTPQQPASGGITPPRQAPAVPKQSQPESSRRAAAERPVPPSGQEGAAQLSQPSLERTPSKTNAPPLALPAGPESFDSLIVKGDVAFQQAKYENALDAYSRAYRLNPRSAEARRKIALTLTLLGRTDEAMKYQ